MFNKRRKELARQEAEALALALEQVRLAQELARRKQLAVVIAALLLISSVAVLVTLFPFWTPVFNFFAFWFIILGLAARS